MSETGGAADGAGGLDVPTIREGIAKLDLSDQKYIVMSALQDLKSLPEQYDDTGRLLYDQTYVDREVADIAHVALKDLPFSVKQDIAERSEMGVGPREVYIPDLNARRQMIITYGVLFAFGVITLAFVVGIALQVKGVDDLGTAFTTLLAAVTGFFAGRGEGQAAGSASGGDGGGQQPPN
jgi:hypothetical protein